MLARVAPDSFHPFEIETKRNQGREDGDIDKGDPDLEGMTALDDL